MCIEFSGYSNVAVAVEAFYKLLPLISKVRLSRKVCRGMLSVADARRRALRSRLCRAVKLGIGTLRTDRSTCDRVIQRLSATIQLESCFQSVRLVISSFCGHHCELPNVLPKA